MWDLEARLAELERRMGIAGRRIREHESRAGQLDLNLSLVFAASGAGGATGTLVVGIRGCSSLNLAGADITLVQGGTTINFSFGTNSSWTFPGLAAGTWNYTVTHPRFNTSTGTVSVAASTVTPLTVNMSAASGYQCIPGLAVPLANTITWADPVLGNVTLTYSAGPGKWVSAAPVTFPAATTQGACPPSGIVAAAYTATLGFQPNRQPTWDGQICAFGGGTFPVRDGGAGGTAGTLLSGVLSGTFTTNWTFSGAVNVSGGGWIYGGTPTLTITD